jgi:ATP synthase protein I
MSKDSRSGASGGIGFALVVMVLLFTVAGYWLDRWLGTRPWLMVVGVFVGFALGLVYLVSILRGESADEAAKKDDEGDDQGPDEPGGG